MTCHLLHIGIWRHALHVLPHRATDLDCISIVNDKLGSPLAASPFGSCLNRAIHHSLYSFSRYYRAFLHLAQDFDAAFIRTARKEELRIQAFQHSLKPEAEA